MLSKENRQFEACLDTIQVISKAAKENLGEDSFYCAQGKKSAIISVFDGCGGLGARKYDTFQGHTGAYIASRIVSGAIHDWYHDNCDKRWKNKQDLLFSVNGYIQNAYKICEQYATERMKIKGSMIRKFPTTFAMAYAEYDGEFIIVHILWAGDSRIYLLDEEGLAQVSKDDTDVEDALENLMNDGAMNNVLSSDGNYVLNYKAIRLKKPGLIFAATDGCFGYVPSPMEFEYILLKSLIKNSTPENFKKSLRSTLAQYAGDDLALGMMSFFYSSYDNTRKQLADRFDFITHNYIALLNKERSDDITQKLWKNYKIRYERYLK